MLRSSFPFIVETKDFVIHDGIGHKFSQLRLSSPFWLLVGTPLAPWTLAPFQTSDGRIILQGILMQ